MNTATTPLTEQKILEITRDRGIFYLDMSLKDTKANIVQVLGSKGLLTRISKCNGISTYELTDEGHRYLEMIDDTQESTEQRHYSDEVTLEDILNKRLQILQSAKRRGLEFNLSDTDVKRLLKKKTCHYTGALFDYNNDKLSAKTFERVDNTKGYVKGNVVAVTLRANRIKNMLLENGADINLSLKEFVNMAEQLKKCLNN